MKTLNADLLTAQTSGYPTGGYAPAVRCIFKSNPVTAGSFVVGTSYSIVTVGTTNFTLIGAASNTVGVVFTATGVGSGTGTASINHDYSFNPALVAAGSFVVDRSYAIHTVGTTNFTLIGAASNTVGVVFTATGAGSGTGIAIDLATASANRLLHAQQIEGRENDPGVILLQNNDKSIPADLTGYYVDLGWGHNTASGIKWDAGAVAPRLWVMQQHDISGGQKGQRPNLYTRFLLQGVRDAILNRQPVLLASTPSTAIPLYRYDELNTITDLTDKTIFEVIKYLLGGDTTPKTGLSLQTGITFTLNALGTQDDGQISTIIPFPLDSTQLIRFINADSPFFFQTYGDLIRSLLELTKCVLIPRAGLAFKIIYPQASDTADETYYSSNASGHPFYEVLNIRLNMVPNHIEIFGGEDETTGYPTVSGHWFDTDHYSGWVSLAETATYDGPFMPVEASGSTDNMLWEIGLDTAAKCRVKAAELGWQLKDQILGGRVIIPMDARVEPYDRVEINDQRGH